MKLLSIITLVVLSTSFFLGKTQYPKQGIIKGSEPTFQDFIKGFEKKKGPLKVTAEDFKKYYHTEENLAKNKHMEIPEKFDKILSHLDLRFARYNVWIKKYYFAKLDDRTILYISSRSTGGYGSIPHNGASCTLVTFDKNGKEVDRQTIAEIGGVKYCASFSMDQDHVFTIQEHENIYKRDISKKGLKNNPIIGKKLIQTKKMQIDAQGKIKVLETKAAKASVG